MTLQQSLQRRITHATKGREPSPQDSKYPSRIFWNALMGLKPTTPRQTRSSSYFVQNSLVHL